MRFCGVEFPLAPPAEWPNLRRQLLPLEASLACRQHDVGCVKDFVFDLALPSHVRVWHRPTQLNAEQRQWLQREVG